MPFDFKNAPAAERKTRFEEIAKESGDLRFLTRRELKHLPELLLEGEQVLSFVSGYMDNASWLIVLTDQRVLFVNKRLLFGITYSSIPLNRVNAATGQTGLITGSIAIEDGATTRVIRNVLKRCVNPFTSKLNQAVADTKHTQGRVGGAG